MESVCVAFWADSPNSHNRIVGMGVGFRDGPSFVLSCAGHGGIAVRKGRFAEKPPENLEFRCLDCLADEVVESIEFDNHSLTLTTGAHQFRIVNNDDELDIMLDGEAVRISRSTGG